jgi:hypothetical protein
MEKNIDMKFFVHFDAISRMTMASITFFMEYVLFVVLVRVVLLRKWSNMLLCTMCSKTFHVIEVYGS